MTYEKGAVRRLAGAALVSLGLFATSASATTLDPFLVFGDSLSDAGFFGGQATDGDTWAAQLGATTAPGSPSYNYAQGGAQAVSSGGALPFGFAEQIGLFQTVAPPITADTWSVVWFGGNDLLGAANFILNPLNGIDLGTPVGQAAAFGVIDSAIDAAVSAISAGITELYTTNMLSNFVVPGLPNLGAIPAFGGAASFAPLATLASAQFNSDLTTELAALQATLPVTTSYVDTFGLFSEIVAGAPGNGFTNLSGTCQALGNCEGYVFWDAIHPTDAAHAVLAQAISANLPAAPIPLPAGAWLLLGGLGALAIARRRRAQVAA